MARYKIINGPSNKRLLRHLGSNSYPRVPAVRFTVQLERDADDFVTGANPSVMTISPEVLMLRRKSAGLDYPSGVGYRFEADVSDNPRFQNTQGFYETKDRNGWIEEIK